VHKSVQITIVLGAFILIALVMLLVFEPNANILINFSQGILEYKPIPVNDIPDIQTTEKPTSVDMDKIVSNTLFSNTHNFEISVPDIKKWNIEYDENRLKQINDELDFSIVAQINALNPDETGHKWQVYVVSQEFKNTSVSTVMDYFIEKYNDAGYKLDKNGIVIEPRIGEPNKTFDEEKGIGKLSAPIELCVIEKQLCVPASSLIGTVHKKDKEVLAVIGFAEPEIDSSEFKIKSSKSPTLNKDIRSIFESVKKYT